MGKRHRLFGCGYAALCDLAIDECPLVMYVADRTILSFSHDHLTLRRREVSLFKYLVISIVVADDPVLADNPRFLDAEYIVVP